MLRAGFIIYLTIIISCNSSIKLNTWKVLQLGGQSNMDGYGHNSQLPDGLKRIPNMIFNGKRTVRESR